MHVDAEEIFQVLHIALRSDPEPTLPVKTALRTEDMQVGAKALRVVTKGLSGNQGALTGG